MQMHLAKMLADRDEWPYEAYGFTPDRNREAPGVFWGAYSPELRIIEKHRGPGIIVWRGNDLKDNAPRTDLWQRQGWEHIATSRWHEAELLRLKLSYRRVQLPGRAHTDVPVQRNVARAAHPRPPVEKAVRDDHAVLAGGAHG